MEKTNTPEQNNEFIKNLAAKAKAGMSEEELAQFARANMPVPTMGDDIVMIGLRAEKAQQDSSIWSEAGKRALITCAEIGAATLTAGAICLLLMWAARKIAQKTPINGGDAQ